MVYEQVGLTGTKEKLVIRLQQHCQHGHVRNETAKGRLGAIPNGWLAALSSAYPHHGQPGSSTWRCFTGNLGLLAQDVEGICHVCNGTADGVESLLGAQGGAVPVALGVGAHQILARTQQGGGREGGRLRYGSDNPGEPLIT